MDQVFQLTLLIVAAIVGLPLTVVTIECLAAHWAGRRARSAAEALGPRVDVLVPAHNEADGIVATIESILPQLGPRDRLWVIADNCQDATAELARRANARVLERTSADQRGKGFALNFGVGHLADDPPEVIVLIDADCVLADGAVAALAERAMATGRPVQGAYLMQAPAGAGSQALVSEFAVTIKNLARPLGLARLGLPCLLTGSGIALPWGIARDARFCGNSIVEDMQLSVDLLLAGHRPVFELAARITAPLPAKRDAAANQRRRWEHGHLQVLCEQVPRLLWAACRQLRWDLLAVAIDIAVPPLSLLGAIWVAATLLAAIVGCATGHWLPAAVLATCGGIAAPVVAVAVRRYTPARVTSRILWSVPVYALSKLSLYASFPFARQTAWNRTSRDLPAGQRRDAGSPIPAAGPHALVANEDSRDSVASAPGATVPGAAVPLRDERLSTIL